MHIPQNKTENHGPVKPEQVTFAHPDMRMKLQSGRRTGAATGVKRLSFKHNGRQRPCKEKRVTPVNWSLHPDLNRQADRDLFSVATLQGRQDIVSLHKAYQRGEPVSTPGAKKALETTAEIVSNLQMEFAKGFSEDDSRKMQELAQWVEDVKNNGCPHDETKQVLFCVATVQQWISQNNLCPGKLPRGVSQVLDLPWNLMQQEGEELDRKKKILPMADCSVSGYNPTGACQWLHLCTYEPLDEVFIFKTMGLPATVVGFLTDRQPEMHDGMMMGPTTMPEHDLNHASGILRGLLEALIPEELCHNKSAIKAFKDMPETDKQVVREQMERFFACMDIFQQELGKTVERESEEFRTLLYMLLFEITHEACLFQLFTSVQPAKSLEYWISETLEQVSRGASMLPGAKYTRENNPEHNEKLNSICEDPVLKMQVQHFTMAILDRFARSFQNGELLTLADITPSASGSP